jgi:hypothetical protein
VGVALVLSLAGGCHAVQKSEDGSDFVEVTLYSFFAPKNDFSTCVHAFIFFATNGVSMNEPSSNLVST